MGDPLRNLKVASPCSADWDSMYGDDRVRFCGSCQLNVYNLSGMTRAEAERLIAAKEGRLCVRYYKRKDGTVLTKDCPVGFAAVRRRLTRVASAVAGLVLSTIAGVGATFAFRSAEPSPVMGGIRPVEYHEPVMGDVAEPPPPIEPVVMGQPVVMGRVAAPPPPKRTR